MLKTLFTTLKILLNNDCKKHNNNGKKHKAQRKQ